MALSIACANSRPSTPVVCKASASAPAKGPSPTASTVNVAHTSSGTLRHTFNTALTSVRGLLTASSKPATAASAVPSTDTASVCQMP